jgi:hypothetical protein
MKKIMMIALALSALLASAFTGSFNQINVKSIDTLSADTAATPEAGAPAASPKEGEERPVSDQERFIIGIFKLEGTDLAITADQAASLIPLWTSMKAYSQVFQPMPDGTPAATPDASATPVKPVDHSEEIAALFDQIKAVLTAEQSSAIATLELDQADMKSFMDEQGIEMPGEMGPGRNQPEGTPSADQMPAPQGTPAANGQQPGVNTQSGQPGQDNQPEGKNESMRVASQNLIDALIELLESKTA